LIWIKARPHPPTAGTCERTWRGARQRPPRRLRPAEWRKMSGETLETDEFLAMVRSRGLEPPRVAPL